MTPTTYEPRVTPEQYLVRERAAKYKSEYYDGVVVAMAGASPAHGRVVRNLATLVGAHLRGGACEHFIADQRVRMREGAYVYPDLVAVCGGAQFEGQDVLTNPTLVVEVLSPSTEADDRGVKMNGYRLLPSLREYLLLAQDRMRAELYRPVPDGGWDCHVLQRPQDVLALESIGLAVRLEEIYEGVLTPRADARRPGPET